MKRIISGFLIICMLICMVPVVVNAEEGQFVHIPVIHKCSNTEGVRKNLSVIKSGEDLLISGEDLAALGGFEYKIKDNNAYFTRGMKTLRVDLSKSRLFPFEDVTLINKIDFSENVLKIEGAYYFPGSEMLPWLNVTCFMYDGILHIHKDDMSIWEIIPQYSPEEFAFDFTECCKELGENGKNLRARAYFQSEGISGIFFDMVPVVGDYLDYYNLFEDVLQDQSAAEERMESVLSDAGDAAYWMGIAEDYEVIEELPDEIQVFGEAAKILANNAVSFAFELGTYVKHFYLHDENILTALHSMELNSEFYGLPDVAATTLVEIRENYSNYYAGIEHKMMVAIGETALDGLTDTATGLYKAAAKLLGFAGVTSPDWSEGINRISSYDVIAEYCNSAYKEMTNRTWKASVRDCRGLAYMYLYACEQNWIAMANYADKKGKQDLKAKYEVKAEAAEEWQRTFMRATSAEENDSHQYGEDTGGTKKEYASKLKKMFAHLEYVTEIDANLYASIEYSIFLEALKNVGVTSLVWDVADSNNDGTNELYVEGSSSSTARNSLLFYDAAIDYTWSYSETGVSGVTSWVNFSGENGYVWQRGYFSAVTQTQSYEAWKANGWESIASYSQIWDINEEFPSGEYQWYGEEVTFEEFERYESNSVSYSDWGCPNLLSMEMDNNPIQIQASLDTYFEKYDGLIAILDNDFDKDGKVEHSYLLQGAANDMLQNMDNINVIGDEKHLNYVDKYLTVVSVEDDKGKTHIQVIRSKQYSLEGDILEIYDAVEPFTFE